MPEGLLPELREDTGEIEAAMTSSLPTILAADDVLGDLCDRDVRQAKDLGLLLALGSDAHSVQEMRTMRLGVMTARRGWLEPRQLLNTMSYQDLDRHFHQRDAMHAF